MQKLVQVFYQVSINTCEHNLENVLSNKTIDEILLHYLSIYYHVHGHG